MDLAVAILLVLLNLASWCTCSDSRLLVKMTLVPNASKIGGCKFLLYTILSLTVLLIHHQFFIYEALINYYILFYHQPLFSSSLLVNIVIRSLLGWKFASVSLAQRIRCWCTQLASAI
jgi:hypothetical protein